MIVLCWTADDGVVFNKNHPGYSAHDRYELFKGCDGTKRKDKIRVISTGGILLPGSFSNVGPLAEKTIESYHVNKVFFSCKGIHYDSGLSETNEMQTLVKLQMIQNSKQAILLIDHTKFGTKDFTKLCSLDMISTLVTDQGTDLSVVNHKIIFT